MEKGFWLVCTIAVIYFYVLISMTKRTLNETSLNTVSKILIITICWCIPFLGLLSAKLSLPSKPKSLGSKSDSHVSQNYSDGGDC